ncbi:MAG TPA: hypothetical protein VGU20_16335 [Stellaceae bacterium]|nr:hypothetical protein [Stellaceae bacterium]
MLTDQSFESFRAYSLDTIARLDEAISVADDVRVGRLPRQALEPVQAELAWSLSKDPMARDIASADIDLFGELIRDSRSAIDDTVRHVTLLKKRLGQRYRALCEEKIFGLFADEKSRIELRHATGFYCSHLINVGYSKSYLLRCVEETFFSNPIRGIGKRNLAKFFRRFDGAVKDFLVYAAVGEDFGRYLVDQI